MIALVKCDIVYFEEVEIKGFWHRSGAFFIGVIKVDVVEIYLVLLVILLCIFVMGRK